MRSLIVMGTQGMTLATGPLARRRFSAAGPVGPQACIFSLARWATRQQIGPPMGLEDTGPTPLVALFAKPMQTTDSHQCIDGYLSPWGCSAWLCLALSLMTQLTAQSIMWLPDTATRLECIVYSAKSKHCSSLVSAFRFQRVSVCKSQYTMHLRDCI